MGSEEPVIIDVREADEYAGGHVAGSLNMPLSGLIKDPDFQDLGKNQKLVLYCNSGNRSGLAANIFKAHGYKNVINGISQSEVEKHYAWQ